ncbi:MAG: hypothetical protein CMK70_14470 [Pseudohongiella sp.]|nr:hypothetical protein [Pseudohongiella sp.]|tara:strand:- start:2498 stop:4879 length:2382 start_codon:yes stop_codon:yes gene_type:complete
MVFITHYWRQFQADKSSSVINLAGLTVAITCALIIFTYVSYHYSFNRFHADSERIYRLLLVDTSQPNSNLAGMVTNALIPAVRDEVPEVEIASRFRFSLSVTVRVNEQIHYLDQALLADSEFFQIFNFPMISGVSGDALNEPNTVVLSQSFARQLFGEQEAVGQVINIFNSRDMRVVGIMEDMPANSHIQADLIMSDRPDPSWPPEAAADLESWHSISMQAYIKLFLGSDAALVQEKIQQLVEEREESGYISIIMQPLEDIHLHSQDVQNEVNAGKEDFRQMYVLSAIAALLMIIAVCNFINLSTAKAVTRAKEVGIRKTVGASRPQLIAQFLTESFVMMAIATLLSLLLIALISPWIAIPTVEQPLNYLFSNPAHVLAVSAILLCTAFFAGLYPAFVLSSERPIGGLKGDFPKSGKGATTRKALVIVQIAISTTAIIVLLVINAQIKFLQNQPLGFDPRSVVYLDFREWHMLSRYQALSNELESVPEISSFTNSSYLPGGLTGKLGYAPQTRGQGNTELMMSYALIDPSFFPTLGLSLIEGENFNDTMTNPELGSVIVNQAAAQIFEWAGPAVGQILRGRNGKDYRVVGVIENARFNGPQHAVEPFVFHLRSEPEWSLIIRMAPEAIESGLATIEAAWERVYPEHPFAYEMLSSRVEGLLGEEVEFLSQLLEFTFLAIFVACLGLYGHATFSANQNARETAIRKVFGASGVDILKLTVREYSVLFLLANAVAWPVGFSLVKLWLSDFTDSVEVGLWHFVQAVMIVVLLGALTISAKVWQVVWVNPVTTLHYE